MRAGLGGSAWRDNEGRRVSDFGRAVVQAALAGQDDRGGPLVGVDVLVRVDLEPDQRAPERYVGIDDGRDAGQPLVEPGTPGQRLDAAALVEGIAPDPAVGAGQRAERQVELQGVDVLIPG